MLIATTDATRYVIAVMARMAREFLIDNDEH
jgi:hypothetical protein